MVKKYYLHGFTSPGSYTRSFSTPVFKREESLYVQSINEKEEIVGFEEISKPSLDCFQNDRSESYSLGDKAIYGVRDEFHELTINNKNNLKHYLRSKINEYIDTPYFYKSVSEFCEYTIPEFIGCKTNKDYLVRQIFSNLASEFAEENKITIDHYFPKKAFPNNLKCGNLIINDYITKNNQYKLTSNQDNISALYNNFLFFVQKKHSKIMNEKSVIDSLNLSKYVLPSWLDEEEVDYSFLRKHLVYTLNNKLNEEKDFDLEFYNPKQPKGIRRFYLKNKKINNIKVEYSEMSTEGLSLIIYVSSLLKKHAKKGNE